MTTHTIALVIIARDASTSVKRLLDSVKPWVDTMLVLDTGSTDGTLELARANALVSEMPWPDDFSVARNAALDLAAADWHLVLDADEWLIEGGEFLHELKHTTPTFVGQIQLLDLDESRALDGPPVARSWLSRLLPGHVRYRGRIHEQPIHNLTVRRTPLVVGHDGYQPQALAAKRGRNRGMLQAALQDDPDNPYLLYQLGKDADIYRDDELASRCFAAAWAQAKPESPWRLDLVVRWIAVRKRLGHHVEAAELATTATAAFDSSPDFHFAIGDLMLDWTATAPDQALALLNRAEQAWRRCLEIGERPDQPGSVPGRGSHLAAFNLALVLEGTSRVAEAAMLRKRFNLDERNLLA
jgi:hypothetical protein